ESIRLNEQLVDWKVPVAHRRLGIRSFTTKEVRRLGRQLPRGLIDGSFTPQVYIPNHFGSGSEVVLALLCHCAFRLRAVITFAPHFDREEGSALQESQPSSTDNE